MSDEKREFVKIPVKTVFWLSSPEEIAAAQKALRAAAIELTPIFITPTDEHDPEVRRQGQNLVSGKAETIPAPPVEESPAPQPE